MKLIEYVGEQPEWVAGHGWVQPGQHLDVREEEAEALLRRRVNRRKAFREKKKP